MSSKQFEQLEQLEREVELAENNLKRFKNSKEESKEQKFTNEVKDNLKIFNELKNKVSPESDNLHILGNCYGELNKVLLCCMYHDYDDNPYGMFCVGPTEAHQINHKLKKDATDFKNKTQERIITLCITHEWVKA